MWLCTDGLRACGAVVSSSCANSRLRCPLLHRAPILGTIPSQLGFYWAPTLRTLELSFNQLSGALPSQIGLLTVLEYLSLGQQNSLLTSTIPSEIAQLSSLTVLSAQLLGLVGTIPDVLWDGLQSLRLIDVSYNYALSGTLPDTFPEGSFIESMTLGNTKLGGPLPMTTLGRLSALAFLDASVCTFTGTLPTQMALLTSLEWLAFVSNSLSGTIPNLAPLKHLDYFNIEQNSFVGVLPIGSFGRMTSMRSINVAWNMFTGPILPEDFSRAFPQITSVALDGNSFSGALPSEISLLTGLSSFEVSLNWQLTGPLPTEVGALTLLEVVDFSMCSFSSSIPSEVGALGNMMDISVSGNTNMFGSIPSQFGAQSNALLVFLESCRLSGPIPSEIFALTLANYFQVRCGLLGGSCPRPARSDPDV